MSLPRDALPFDTMEAVRVLADVGRGGMERKLADLARLLTEREELIASLEALLDRIEAVAGDPKAQSYDVAKAVRGILGERER